MVVIKFLRNMHINDLVEEPLLFFMGNIKDKNKKDIEFLNLVIKEIIDMEEVLDD